MAIEKTLFAAADKMRGSMDPGEYKHVALGLLFLRYISIAFQRKYDELLPEGKDVARHLSMNAGVRMSNAWRRLPQIVIAALEGPAIGGGAILALCADFRVMSEEAYLRFPEVRLGMTLGWGGLPLLTERVGAGRAKRILCCDETIGADEALELGLADRKVPAGTALDAARAWAATISESPAMSLRMTKSAIDARARRNWAEGAEGDQFLLAKLLAEGGSTA